MDLVVQAGLGATASLLVGGILWRRKVAELPDRWRRLADNVEIALLACLALYVLVRTYGNAVNPAPWDFPVFYTVAVSAAEGLSFYDPNSLLATFTEIQRQWNVPADWLVEVGFWYAPPTALYLAPLGFLSYPGALITNDLVQVAFFGTSIVLLHRYFPLREGPIGLVEMALLGLLFRPILSAFRLSQIVFGALFCLVLATGTVEGRRWVGGLALGVGALFKHLLLIPAALAIALRRWRMALAALAGLLATMFAAGLVFGFDVYRGFVTNGPGDRSPELALDPVIQSLNGALRRFFDAVPTAPGALDAILYPPYLIAAGVFTVVTLLIARRVEGTDWGIVPGFALISLLSLLVYPNTLFNTLPLMLPALIVLVHSGDRLGVPSRVQVLAVVAVYGAVGLHSRLGFAALVFAWAFLAVSIVRKLRVPQMERV